MPDNRNSEVALNYHNATKHSYASVRTNQHSLDFNNQPIPFKIYPTLEPSPLPAEVRQTGVAALSAISEIVPPQTDAAPDLEAIAQLLYLSAGITRHRKYPGGEIYFRAAACTGALYEIELYLVCGDLAEPRSRRLSLRRRRVRPAPAARRRLSQRPDRCHGRRACHRSRSADHRLHRHLLAQRLEVSGPHLPPFRLGQRHPARQPAGRRHCAGPARQSSLRIRRRHRESPARRRSSARGGFFAGAARPRLRHFRHSLRPPSPLSDSKPSRSLATRSTIPSCAKCTPPLRCTRPKKLPAWRGGTPLDSLSASRRTGRPASTFIRRGNTSRPDRAGHPAARFQPQVCPHADHPGATLHHARSRHSRRARRFSRSCGIATQPPLSDRPRRGGSRARSLRLPPRPRIARTV